MSGDADRRPYVGTKDSSPLALPGHRPDVPGRGSDPAFNLGWWAGLAVVVFSVGFTVPGFLTLADVVGFPWDPVLADTSSLLLSWAFLAMMTALHHTVSERRKVWTALAAHLAVGYALLVGIVYFVTVTVVVPLEYQGRGDSVALLHFDDQGSLMQALDGLGYFAMSMATLTAAAALQEPADRWVRRVFVINGVLGIPILVSYMPLVFSWSSAVLPVNVLWVVSVPLSGVLAGRRFRRLGVVLASRPAASGAAPTVPDLRRH